MVSIFILIALGVTILLEIYIGIYILKETKLLNQYELEIESNLQWLKIHRKKGV